MQDKITLSSPVMVKRQKSQIREWMDNHGSEFWENES